MPVTNKFSIKAKAKEPQLVTCSGKRPLLNFKRATVREARKMAKRTKRIFLIMKAR